MNIGDIVKHKQTGASGDVVWTFQHHSVELIAVNVGDGVRYDQLADDYEVIEHATEVVSG